MTEQRPHSASGPDDQGADGLGMAPDQGGNVGTPRWVKVFGAIALVVVLLVIILFLAGGDHSPGRHGSSSVIKPWDGLIAMASGAAERGLQQL